ncbi:hypothetical protein HY229_03440 [Candidatus Acetothermia bacterium]|nr:hypothetical protein [Candidatus Acetothermia bacterium]MBI3643137.1 hypothetical protein [Candidatus Acetothermia bacterium]
MKVASVGRWTALLGLTLLFSSYAGAADSPSRPLLCGQDRVHTSSSESVNPCNLMGEPVGIGTLTPTAQLDIFSELAIPLQVRSMAKLARIILEGSVGSEIIGSAQSSDKFLALKAAQETSNGAFIDLLGSTNHLIDTGAGSVLIGAAAASPEGDILFRTQGLNRMILNQDGQIGIGTADPIAQLQISSQLSLPLRVETRSSVANFELEGQIGSTITSSSEAVDKFLALQSTSSVDTGATIALLGMGIEGTGTGPGSVLIESARASPRGDILLRTMGLNRLIINQDGNVGIGTLEPKAKLHIIGNEELDGNLVCSSTCVNSGAVKGLQIYVPLYGVGAPFTKETKFVQFDSLFLGKDLIPPAAVVTLYVRGKSSAQNGCWEVRILGSSAQHCGTDSARVEIQISSGQLPDKADELWLEFRSNTSDSSANIEKAWLIVYNP